jgi:phosphoglycolate phosphatase-like HAD superfamily hydrolase
MHLVMFDIDGTLVDSAGFDGALYAQAVESVLNVAVDRDWDRYENVTDSGILDQLLRESGAAGDRAALALRVQRHFIELIRAHVARNVAAVEEIAGARRLVGRLVALPGVRVAVATGGWEETARLKLAHVGIDTERLAFASSSDALARTAIMRIAERRALNDGGYGRATYFGDGPWDRRASAELGYEFIAVGKAVAHPVAFDDLSDTEAILGQLRALEAG